MDELSEKRKLKEATRAYFEGGVDPIMADYAAKDVELTVEMYKKIQRMAVEEFSFTTKRFLFFKRLYVNGVRLASPARAWEVVLSVDLPSIAKWCKKASPGRQEDPTMFLTALTMYLDQQHAENIPSHWL